MRRAQQARLRASGDIAERRDDSARRRKTERADGAARQGLAKGDRRVNRRHHRRTPLRRRWLETGFESAIPTV